MLPSMEPISAFAMYNKKKIKKMRNLLEQPVTSNGTTNGSSPLKKKFKKTISDNYDFKKLDKSVRTSTPKDEQDEDAPKKKKNVKPVAKEQPKVKKTKKVKELKIQKNETKTITKKKRKVEDEEEPPLLVPIESNEVGKFVKRRPDLEDNPILDIISDLHKTNPITEGLKVFKWLINPLSPEKFFKIFWETEVTYIQRNSPNYYSSILSTQRLDDIFREFPLYYNKNVDVVSYENGVKEVHNEEGKVVASALYDYYSNGCSVRILNPQTYDSKVHLLISTLQEYFGTMVGANVYLTPPGSQGFAPHFDDIEAFIIQLEGRKHWKLYRPENKDVLARFSSKNFTHEEIGEPFMEITLNAGDLLYFPRGIIHEGRTDENAHSLHITVSVYQRTAYVDLLEHVIPDALKKAAENDIEFRKGLPIDYLKHLGHVNKNSDSDIRETVINQVQHLMKSLLNYVDADQAADKLGRKFMYDSMPPVLSKQEVQYTSKYDGDFMKDGKIYNRIEIDLDTEVRLMRYHCLRLVIENDSAKIYYNTDNSKVYHGEEEQFLSIDENLIPGIEMLQNSYPKYVKVNDLPIEDPTVKSQLVSDLWEKGLLVTNGPLPPYIFDEEQSTESEEEIDSFS